MDKSNKINWGIIGPGRIANKFAQSLITVEEGNLYAVLSRTMEKATAFGDEYGAERCFDQIDHFISDKNIEVVYIATPHPMHKEYAKKCMEAGISVLCEKPVTINQKELSELVECAIENDVFFMEGVWTRFLPAVVKVRELLDEGILGDITRLTADFAFNAPQRKGRLFELELGGGALLDAGIYPINFAEMILGGKPLEVKNQVYIGESGVDERASIDLLYPDGVMANLFTSITAWMRNEAVIYGEKGHIVVPKFWCSQEVKVCFDNGDQQVYALPYEVTGFVHEIKEVHKCLRAGAKESDIMPLSASMDVMKIMDDLRKEWGLKYPTEM